MRTTTSIWTCLVALGITVLMATTATADDQTIPTTTTESLGWNVHGELVLSEDNFENRLADAINDAATGHEYGDDDHGDGVAYRADSGEYDDDDDEDDFKGACGCQSSQINPGAGLFLLATLGLCIGRRKIQPVENEHTDEG